MSHQFIRKYGDFISFGLTQGVFMFCFLVAFFYFISIPAEQREMSRQVETVLSQFDLPNDGSIINTKSVTTSSHNRKVLDEVLIIIVVLLVLNMAVLVWMHSYNPSISIEDTIRSCLLSIFVVFCFHYGFHERVINRYKFVDAVTIQKQASSAL